MKVSRHICLARDASINKTRDRHASRHLESRHFFSAFSFLFAAGGRQLLTACMVDLGFLASTSHICRHGIQMDSCVQTGYRIVEKVDNSPFAPTVPLPHAGLALGYSLCYTCYQGYNGPIEYLSLRHSATLVRRVEHRHLDISGGPPSSVVDPYARKTYLTGSWRHVRGHPAIYSDILSVHLMETSQCPSPYVSFCSSFSISSAPRHVQSYLDAIWTPPTIDIFSARH